MKTCALFFGLAMTIGMFWKKRRMSIPWRGNKNVITLNQTLLFVVLVYIDNALLAYYLGTGGRFLFNLEMMRIIFIEKVTFFPFSSAALWTDREGRRVDFPPTNPGC